MDFFEVTKNRYSYKRIYKDTPVPLADLEKIAAAGLSAPTGVNTQCVSLIIIGRPELDKLEAVVHANSLASAPAAIALFTDPKLSENAWHDFTVEDYAAAAATMCLASVALGYVSVWLDGCFFDPLHQEGAKAALGLPERCHLRVVIPVGYPAEEEPRRPKKPFEARVSYGQYGIRRGDQ